MDDARAALFWTDADFIHMGLNRLSPPMQTEVWICACVAACTFCGLTGKTLQLRHRLRTSASKGAVARVPRAASLRCASPPDVARRRITGANP